MAAELRGLPGNRPSGRFRRGKDAEARATPKFAARRCGGQVAVHGFRRDLNDLRGGERHKGKVTLFSTRPPFQAAERITRPISRLGNLA